MQKIISLVLVLALAFVGVLPVFAATFGEYTGDPLTAVAFTTSNTKILGRTNPANPFLIGTHTSGVEFNVTGTTTVGIRLKSYNDDAAPEGEVRERDLYFEVDGVQVVISGGEHTAVGTNDYIIATDLDPDTTHNIKVTLDEENWAQYNFAGFYMTHALVDNGATVSKAADSEIKILVYGDSITSANNIGGAHLSYHQLLAKNFDADTQAFSAGGGIFANYYNTSGSQSQGWNFQLARDWNTIAWKTDFYRGMLEMADANNDSVPDPYETDANNVNFDPDLVLINIGTNDRNYIAGTSNSYKEQNQQLFEDGFYAMLDEMFGFDGGAGYYSDTTVILSYGLMGLSDEIVQFYDSLVSTYLNNHQELVGSGPMGNDRLVTYYYEPCSTTKGTIGGGNAHPNAASHAYEAEKLTTYLEEYMGWERKPEYTAYPNNSGVLENLPEAKREENKLFLGFVDEEDEWVKKGDTITWGAYIYSKYLDVTLGGLVDADGNPNDPNPVKTNATYTNGFHIQGAQVRVGLTPEDKATGLRFIVVNNTEIKAALETAITEGLNYERGLVVIAGTKYKGGEIKVDTESATPVKANNIFASTTTLGATYDKYTACVTNIPEEYFSTNVIVRPYFKYTDISGTQHVYYGEQYSCSLFAAANAAYRSGEESDEIEEYLYNNIISKCNGDNDTELEF